MKLCDREKIEEVIRRKGSKDECGKDKRNLVIVW